MIDPDRSDGRDRYDVLDGRIDVRAGFDTDGDHLADTVLFDEDDDLVIASDTDRDGLADLVIEIGPTAHPTTLLGPPTAGDWIGVAVDQDPHPTPDEHAV